MSLRPLRLSELKLGTPSTEARPSRGSKLPIPSSSRKRSLSTEPKSATKIRIRRTSGTRISEASQPATLRRSKSTATLCTTPMVTPTRSPMRSSSRNRIPNSQNLFRKESKKPVMDKNWIMVETNKLHQYLTTNGMTDCLPKGPLKSMSVKQFITIIQHFAIKLTDNRIKITMANYIDELPRMMKILEYPGQLSRSILIAPNTMHSWPHALALLSWLRTTSQYMTQSDLQILENSEINKKLHLKLEAIYKMYILWNQENESDIAGVIEEYENKVTENDDENPSKLDEMIDEKRKNIEQFELTVHEKQLQLKEIEMSLKEYDDKRKYLVNLEDERQLDQDKIDACQKKIETLSVRYNDLLDIKKQLNFEIKSQPINIEKKLEIESNITELNRQIDSDRKICSSLTEANFELDLKLNLHKTALDKNVVDYNCLIWKLKEGLSSLGINYDMNRIKLSVSDFQCDDIDTKLEGICMSMAELTQKLQDEYKSKEKLRTECLSKARLSQERKDNIKKQTADLKTEIQLVEQVISKLREDSQLKIVSYQTTVSKLTKRIAELNEEIHAADKYEDLKLEAVRRFRQSKLHMEKLLEMNKNLEARLKDEFLKHLRNDRAQLHELHSAIVETNDETVAFMESINKSMDK